MGQALGFIIVIAAALGITALVGARDRAAAYKKAVSELRESFGSKGNKIYPDGRFVKIDRYYERHRGSFCIDDITWNDLDLDSFFCRLDRTCSAAGEEYLYRMLRCPSTDGSISPGEEAVNWWTEQEDKRIAVQLALRTLGNSGKYSLYDYLDALDDLEDRPLMRDLPAVLLPAAALGIMFLNTRIGLLLLLAVLAFNMVRYFRVKAAIDPYLQTFRYILRLIACAQTLSGLEMPSCCGKEKDMIAEGVSSMSSFARGSGILLRGNGTNASGNPFSLLLDYLCILFHFDLMKYGSMLRQIRGRGRQVDGLITAVGSIDAQISIASFAASLSQHCVPQFREGPLQAENMIHPMLEEPVPASILTDRPVLITGSNASGKSTFLKTVAICALLGQSIGLVPASGYSARPYRIYTSMALRDDLRSGDSYFLVEIRSLKRVLDAAREREDAPVLCCVDEVLRGTNTLERISASTEILSVLAKDHVQVFAATHDLELTGLLKDQYDNYHFSEEIDGDDVHFSYGLLPGSADSRNAIRLLRMLGYDAQIADRAQERAEHFLETGEWKE